VNAMAIDMGRGKEGIRIIDLFGGQEDLKNKIIRAVGDPRERFSEDALRMLRAIRFSVTLGRRMAD
jgi:tRNA nucleotidyltransferase (CCA-adding enzyme)